MPSLGIEVCRVFAKLRYVESPFKNTQKIPNPLLSQPLSLSEPGATRGSALRRGGTYHLNPTRKTHRLW